MSRRKRVIPGRGARSNNPREIRHGRLAASFDDSFSERTCLVTVAPFPSVLLFFPPGAISALPTTRRYSFPFLRLVRRDRSEGKLIQPVPRQDADIQLLRSLDRVFSRFSFLRSVQTESTYRGKRRGNVHQDSFLAKSFRLANDGILTSMNAQEFFELLDEFLIENFTVSRTLVGR